MVPTKAVKLPITVDEIVADVRRCRAAGASIVHLHARAEDGSTTYRKDIYWAILEGVRAACPDIILCVSTVADCSRASSSAPKCSNCSEHAPEMASLTLGCMQLPTRGIVKRSSMTLVGREDE